MAAAGMTVSQDIELGPIDTQSPTTIAGYGISALELVELNTAKSVPMLKELGGVEGIAKLLKSNDQLGLTSEEADSHDRTTQYGINEYPRPKPTPLLLRFFRALKDTMLVILMLLASLSIVLGVAFPEDVSHRNMGWIEGAAIGVAVVLVSSVTALNDWSKDRQFRKLSEANDEIDIHVIRDGKPTTISIKVLRAGDVVELAQGDQVPADGILIEGFNLKTDESVMTGETDMIKKSAETPFMLSGCQVADGNGKMLVTAVGIYSEWGQTISKLVKEDEETPLQQKLEVLSKDIGKIGTSFAVATFIILLIGFIIRNIVDHLTGNKLWDWNRLSEIVGFIIIAVTIVVVAVPEGLPLAVTMSLAFSVKKMMKDNNLVRHLSACETMGGATNICSDKTGTLTLNQMRVVKAWIAQQEYFDQLPQPGGIVEAVRVPLCQGIAVNSTANISRNESNPSREFETAGNKTECALLILSVKDLGEDYEAIRKDVKDRNAVRQMYTFSSDRKRMSTIIRLVDGRFRLFCKGAGEIVLGLCNKVVTPSGDAVPLTAEMVEKLENIIVQFASQGLRTICMAYRDFDEDGGEEWDSGDPPEKQMTVIGIVGIKDPLRPEVRDAVAQCKRSGIFVRMVTGDNLLTARFIARDCGILSDGGLAMEGKEFRKLSDSDTDAILPRLQVLARSTPSDKYKLVHRLRELGEVVAVTGDGTNDAPALKEADVGLSMGLSGTEVAKEASDIVIMDDNFSSIVKAVLWGRSVFENIRKFLQFQLTVNLVALMLTCITAFTSAFVVRDPPLTAVQLLWVNLIMDTFAALALATEPPHKSLLERKPYGRYENLITSIMIRNLLAQGIFQLVILSAIYYFGFTLRIAEPAPSNATTSEILAAERSLSTVVFNTFVFCQAFNEINSRKINKEFNIFGGLHKSPMFIVIWIITAAVQALIVTFGGAFTQTAPLNWMQWLLSISIGALSIPIGLLVRFIPVPARPPGKPPKKKANKETHMEIEVIVSNEIPKEKEKPKEKEMVATVVTEQS